MESITIYAEAVEDIGAIGADMIEVTLSGVDIGNIIAEVGQENVLDEIPTEDIQEYLDNLEKDSD